MKRNTVKARGITKTVLALFAAVCTFSVASQVLARPKTEIKFSTVCQYQLTHNLQTRIDETNRVADEFGSRAFHNLGPHQGFSLNRHADLFEQEPPVTNTIHVESQAGDYGPAVVQEAWRTDGKSYIFMNVGLKSLEKYSDRVNRNVFAHLLTRPDDDLVVQYDRPRSLLGRRLMRYRWAVHDAVMDIYSQKKPYLTEDDFRSLVYLNRISHNSDVLALLTPRSQAPNLGIKNRVMLTIQISYFGDRHYFRPSMRDLIGRETAYTNDLLPFEYRIPIEQLGEFRERFYSRFPARYTCEMLRYASMDNQIPQEIRDRFLYKAFLKAEQRGMRYIIAGADRFTERLYRRYGFTIYTELPTAQHSEPEYVLYLRVGSPEFEGMMERLRESSKSPLPGNSP